ncbi:MAG TPA: SMC-Scp complex subunit ScpB [Verrucomicrobiae bacterium]|nr:SMC-Scp complex subunit ScpB [Verrucomicrobiae bacterium]
MEIKFILESLLFSAQKPMSEKELRDLLISAATTEDADDSAKPFKKVKDSDVTAALEALARDHETAARSYRLACVAGAWQFVTQPEFSPWLRALVGVKNRPTRLSQAALETLAIIAYRQPVTRAEVESVRGVNVDGTMQTILERGLVEQSGRAEVVGRPALYSTTPFFLEYFGLPGLEELPAADELRRIQVVHPPAPITADPGLATAAPEQLVLGQTPEKIEEPPVAGPAAEAASESVEPASSSDPEQPV